MLKIQPEELITNMIVYTLPDEFKNNKAIQP